MSINEPPVSKNKLNGIDFKRMSAKIADSFKRDYAENVDWNLVIENQAKEITNAIFEELSKMTFYIEIGEIQVLTNGSPSTQQGMNTNRIKIKLK